MKVMLTVRSSTPPSLDEIKRNFGLLDSEVDQSFGVIEIDPDDQLFAFMVDKERAEEISAQIWQVDGPFSNPRIQPFGPLPDSANDENEG